MQREDSWLKGFPSAPNGGGFPTTDWPCVWSAVKGGEEERKAAIAELFQAYYKPVYRFFRRTLKVPEKDVADLTQEFFEKFLEKDYFRHIEHETSFRAYLRTLCRWHFGEWCQRRGIDCRRSPGSLAEELGPAPDIADPRPDTLEAAINEEFRRSYIADALEATRLVLLAKGKELHYRILLAKVAYEGEREPPNAEIAARHALGLNDVRNRLYEARKIFRAELLRLASLRSKDPEGELRALGIDLGRKRRG